MHRRIDPALYWFLCAFGGLVMGCWWITQNIPDSGARVEAFLGLLVIAALSAQAGMERFTDHR